MLLRLLQNDIRAQQQLLFDYNWGPTDIYGIHLDFNSKGKKSSVPIRGECVFKVLIFDPFLPFSPLLTTSTERVVYSWKSQILPSWTSIASGRQMDTHLFEVAPPAPPFFSIWSNHKAVITIHLGGTPMKWERNLSKASLQPSTKRKLS